MKPDIAGWISIGCPSFISCKKKSLWKCFQQHHYYCNSCDVYSWQLEQFLKQFIFVKVSILGVNGPLVKYDMHCSIMSYCCKNHSSTEAERLIRGNIAQYRLGNVR